MYDTSGEGTVYTDNRAKVSVYSSANDQQQSRTRVPSSTSSLTSAQSYPRAKSEDLESSLSLFSSGTGFCSNAAAKLDLPDDGCPSNSTCFEGMDRDEDTESKIEDHKS